jgi:hypothetical protein
MSLAHLAHLVVEQLGEVQQVLLLAVLAAYGIGAAVHLDVDLAHASVLRRNRWDFAAVQRGANFHDGPAKAGAWAPASSSSRSRAGLVKLGGQVGAVLVEQAAASAPASFSRAASACSARDALSSRLAASPGRSRPGSSQSSEAVPASIPCVVSLAKWAVFLTPAPRVRGPPAIPPPTQETDAAPPKPMAAAIRVLSMDAVEQTAIGPYRHAHGHGPTVGDRALDRGS